MMAAKWQAKGHIYNDLWSPVNRLMTEENADRDETSIRRIS